MSCKSEFEWYAHRHGDARAGQSEVELATLHRGEEPKSFSSEESAVFRVARALVKGDLPDESWP